ncbi:MFS transporter [Modestobacter sp. VKM Ac-2977]|uniref:MFS transporter n=1 Tax=Modestobacter sp. VKM Ac-2977 TaxID=3004131 RepID=UPI0022AB1EFF|nr:MFS transporter [Modestobacter sp. VKM Ac-2977]MCZ2818896.1 MFS transporter [Modestobacter sp. VKM Ac-2977]
MTAPSTPTVAETSPVAAGRPPWGLLTTLWVTQYVGIGFLTVGLVAILRADGVSLADLSLVSLLGLAWPLKLLWAPLLDRYGSRRLGHHRSWLLALQSAMVLALLALLPFDDPAASLGPLVVVCAVYVLLSATQDVAADALAVRLLRPEDRGLGNGVQVGASYVGTVLGGGLCVLVYDRAGWTAAVLLLAALTLVALVVVLRFREPERDPRVPGSAAWAALIGVFRRPGVPVWALGVVPLVYGGAAGVYALPSAALVDAGWSLTRIGVVTGVVVSVPAALAGPLAGWLVRRWGRAAVLVGGGVALALSTAGLVPLLLGSAPLTGTVVALSGFLVAYTALNVVVYTVSMDLSRPATAGTDFTTLTTVPLLASFLTASAALATAALVGYVVSAALWCGVTLVGVVLGVRWLRAAPLR